MEDLGFFPYPSSALGTTFEDVLMDPGPASFFLKDPTGEDVLLGHGVEELNTKMGWDLFGDDHEMNKGSPINVDDDLLMGACDIKDEPIDVPFSMNDIKYEGLIVVDGIVHDPNDMDMEQLCDPRDVVDDLDLDEMEEEDFFGRDDDGHLCQVCKIALFGLKEVINHIVTLHCSKNNYSCTLCHLDLTTGASVKKHVKNVHFGFKSFECPVCKKVIQQKSHLKKHIEKQHGGRKGLLKKALKSSGRQTKLNRVLKGISNSAVGQNKSKLAALNNSKLVKYNKNDLTCPLCHKVYLSVETKERHLLTFHHKKGILMTSAMNQQTTFESGIKCQQSGGGFYQNRQHLHFMDETEALPINLQCPICHEVMPNLEQKRDHVRNVHHNLKSFECELCNGEFYSKMHLSAHKKVSHDSNYSGKKSVHCEYHNCKTVTKNVHQMLSHVEEFHAYQCPECPRHLQTTSGLAKHYKKAHISNELLCCKFCGNCYKDEPELSHHIKEKHNSSTEEEEEPVYDFESSSNASFCNQSLLIEKVMHSGVLNSIKKSVNRLKTNLGPHETLPCEYCRANETFATEIDVIEHVKAMHPIQCPDCPMKMFKYPTSVRKHFRKFHPQEVPYFCRTCTLVFKDADRAQIHMDNEHGIPNVVVPVLASSSPPNSQSGPKPQTPQSNPKTHHHPIKMQPTAPTTTTVPKPVTVTTKFSTPKITKFSAAKVRCTICNLGLESSLSLADHRAETHPYCCPECSKEYKLTDSLRKHFKTTHNENVTMTCCKYCDLVILDPGIKSGHVAKFHPDCIGTPAGTPIAEVVAMQVVDSSTSFNTGGGETPTTPNTQFVCPKCPRGYNGTDGVRKHAKTVHGLNLMFCKDCNMVFMDANTKNGHMNRVHGSATISSSQTSLLIRTSPPIMKISAAAPESNSSSGGEESYQCPKCPKVYNIAKSLRKHCRKNHDKLSICFCHHCPQVFIDVARRDRHQEKDHPNMKPNPNSAGDSFDMLPEPKEIIKTPIKTTIAVTLGSSTSATRTISLSPVVAHRQQRVIVVNGGSRSGGPLKTTTIIKKVEIVQPQKCANCQELVAPVHLIGHVCDLPWKCPNCPKKYKLCSGVRKHFREIHGGFELAATCEVCKVAFKGQKGLEEHNREKHSSVPSSPESFHGFVTPTKELEMSKEHETFLKNLNSQY